MTEMTSSSSRTVALGFRFLLLAVRMLRRNRRRSLLTLASLVMGYAILITAFALSEAAVQFQIDEVCRKSSGHVQVFAPGFLEAPESGAYLREPVSLDAIRRIAPGIVARRSRVHVFGFLEANRKKHFIQVRGIDPAVEPPPVLVAGDPLPAAARRIAPHPILLGRLAAGHLGVGPGDLVLLSYVRPDGILDDVQCRVSGLTDEGTPEGDRRLGTVHLDAARRFMEMGTGSHQEILLLEDPASIEPVVARLRASLGEGAEVVPWHVVNPQLRRITHLNRASMGLLAAVVILISVFSIAGVMAMSVAERTREFGLFAAMGMARRDMVACVVLEGVLLGTLTLVLAGVASWLVLQVLSVRGVDFTFLVGEAIILDGVRIEMILHPRPEGSHFFWATALVWGTSFIASLWPAWRASRLDPLEAMVG